MIEIKAYTNGSYSYYSPEKKKHINIPSELARMIMNKKELLIDFIEYAKSRHVMPILHSNIESLVDDYLHQPNQASKVETKKVKCKCPCHKSNGQMKHVVACCEGGYKTAPEGYYSRDYSDFIP